MRDVIRMRAFFVARMQRSEIRGLVGVAKAPPDSIAFHPGYAHLLFSRYTQSCAQKRKPGKIVVSSLLPTQYNYTEIK